MATMGAMAVNSAYGFSMAGTFTAGAAPGTGILVGGGPVGWIVGVGLLVGGALVDSKIMASLAGKGRGMGDADRLIGLPTGSYGQGEPSIWAIGTRIRVPVHALWQSEKIREYRTGSSGGSLKAGTGVQMKRVYVDCALAVNERLSRRVVQLIGGGKLLTYETRNIISVRSHEITVSTSGGRLVLTMQDVFSPDFSQKFAVGDIVTLSGFVPASGTPNVNGTYWKVQAVTSHALSPSVLTLDIYQGQSLASLNSTAGNAASPASITRIDDALVEHRWNFIVSSANGTHVSTIYMVLTGGDAIVPKPNALFATNDDVRLSGFSASSVNAAKWTVYRCSETMITVIPAVGQSPILAAPLVGMTAGTSSNASRIEFWNITTSAPGLFPSTFVPANHFHGGTETQTEDSVIVATEGAGNVGGYRGVAYQVLDDFDCTQWNGLPPQMEVLLEPDAAMDWARAFLLVSERGGIPGQFLNVSGVTPRPFEGMYLRGPVPGATALQSLLIAGQVATQDRDGVLCFSDIDNLDVVQIENGASYSDLGARMHGAQASDTKLSFKDPAPEDLPTSIGIRHQDPDNFYTDGYQTRGNRHPSADIYENRQEVNLSNIAMPRKQAHELCGTIMRRSFVNAREVSLSLPSSYLDVLENDLLTVTDDDGNEHTVRATRVDVGANMLVEVTGVLEELEIAVSGSPVQSVAGNAPQPFIQLASVVGVVLDMPALRDVEGVTPGLLLAAAPRGAGSWAGCTVYKTQNAGADWNVVATLSDPACIGTLATALDAGTASESHGSTTLTWDTSASFDVLLDHDGLIPPVTAGSEAEVAAGAWWYAVTDLSTGETEIIGVRDVTQTAANSYTFSHLLRGLRGTKPIEKLAGCQIVQVSFLSQIAGRHVDQTGSNATIEFRFVAPGQDLESTPSVSLTAAWRNVLPLPVRDVTKAIDGSNDARFTFDHWTRQVLPLGSLGPYPLVEANEQYRVRIFDPTGTSLRRVFVVTSPVGTNTVRDKWVDYTAANQTTDGYTPGPSETFWIDVQQVGDYGTGPSNLMEL